MRRRRKRYYSYAREQKIKKISKLFSLLLIILIFLVLLDTKARPIIHSVASDRANNIASAIASNAVDSYLGNNNIHYSDLSTFIYDNNQNISAVNINIETANMLESKISDIIVSELEKTQRAKIEIPIGTILGGNFMSGRGPKIRVYMSLTGRCNSNVTSEFSDAGINQTRHRVILNIITHIHIIMNGRDTSTKVENNIIIAETILLGNVPLAYSSGEWYNKEVENLFKIEVFYG